MPEMNTVNSFRDAVRTLFYRNCDVIRHDYCKYTIRIPSDDITCVVDANSVSELAFTLNNIKQGLAEIYYRLH